MNAVKQINRSIIMMNLIKMFFTIRRKKMDVSSNTFVQDATVVHARETAVTTSKDERC